jgi:PHD/YefM family antitoxin component YafN of YafNO toxin-antitoxin module
MPERLTSTSKARAKLRRLSQTAQKNLDRYIITVRGEPQSVLIGYDEYQSMKAAVELMQRPEVVEDIKAGLKELDEGKGVPLTEMKARVREAGRLKETNKLAQELAAESGVDSHIVETVMIHLGEKMMNVLSTQGSPFIPRVVEIDQELILRERQLSPTIFSWKPGGDTLSRKEFVEQ